MGDGSAGDCGPFFDRINGISGLGRINAVWVFGWRLATEFVNLWGNRTCHGNRHLVDPVYSVEAAMSFYKASSFELGRCRVEHQSLSGG